MSDDLTPDVAELVDRIRTRLAELAEFAEVPRDLFKAVVDLQLEVASALTRLSSERDELREALDAAYERAAQWHDGAAATALKQAESAEREGFGAVSRHQYTTCGVHETSAAYLRSLKSMDGNAR